MLNDSSDRDFLLKICPQNMHVCVLVALSCSTLCNPMDCSPPGSSVHRLLHARILQWVTMPFPGDLLDPGIKPSLLHCKQIIWVTREAPRPPPEHVLCKYTLVCVCIHACACIQCCFHIAPNKKWCSIHFDLKRMVTIYDIESLCEVK